MRRWSMTVGEMRAAIEGVPDDYEVVLDDAEVGDCEISSLHIERLMGPDESPGWCIEHGYMNCSPEDPDCLIIDSSPGLLVLGGGAVVSSEYRYGPRLDTWLDRADRRGRWKNCALDGYQWGWVE